MDETLTYTLSIYAKKLRVTSLSDTNSILTLIVTGIFIYGACFHLASWLFFRKQIVNLAFTLFCIIMANFSLASFFIYEVKSTESAIMFFKWQVCASSLLMGTTVWFTASYANLRAKVFMALYIPSVLLLFLLNIMMPYTLLFTNIESTIKRSGS